jgi:hypothetical protein
LVNTAKQPDFTLNTMSGQQRALAITKDTEQVAQYLGAMFKDLQEQGTGSDLMVPMEWGLEYLIEVDLAANVMWRAFQNQSKQSILPIN